MNKIIFIIIFVFFNTQIWCDGSTQIELYDQIIENDCIINILSNGKYFYKIEIQNNFHKTKIETEWFSSRPFHGLGWINNNLLIINFGSGLNVNRCSYFYSKELHMLSNEYYLITVVDENNNLVLCADDYCVIYSIFYPERKFVLNALNFYDGGGIPFFRIGRNTRFEDKKIILEYYDEKNELKTEIINLENTILY